MKVQTTKQRNDLIYEWDLCEERAASPESLKRTIGKTRRVTLAAASPTVAAPEARRRRASSAAATYSSSSSNLVVGHSSKSRKVLTHIIHAFLFDQIFHCSLHRLGRHQPLLSLQIPIFLLSFLYQRRAIALHSLIHQICAPSFVFFFRELHNNLLAGKRHPRMGRDTTAHKTKPATPQNTFPSASPRRLSIGTGILLRPNLTIMLVIPYWLKRKMILTGQRGCVWVQELILRSRPNVQRPLLVLSLFASLQEHVLIRSDFR